MVLIHCKYKGEEQQFLYETTVEIGVKDPVSYTHLTLPTNREV